MKTRILPTLATVISLGLIFSCEEAPDQKRTDQDNGQTREIIPDQEKTTSSNSNNKKTKIKLALILDTSNSMDGLIDQAKNQLWKIVMELAKTKDKYGEDPDIDLALYQYGNSGLSMRHGYVQKVKSFTGELDEISEKLFALKTNGGQEYCGTVINTSLNELVWSESKDDLQMIYIAGNEEFNQGFLDYTKACGLAKQRNVTVNTIFCGAMGEGIRTFWKHGADLTGGHFAVINSDAKSVHYNSPYDDQISNLNVSLNKTYVPYSSAGRMKKEKQIKEDQNAKALSSANASKRYLSKGSKVYKNSSWDLVDYSKQKNFDVEKLEQEHLPDSLKAMSKPELSKKITELSNKRDQIKKEMAALSKKRDEFVAQEKTKALKNDSVQLEDVIIKGLKEQANKKSIVFNETIN